MFKKFLNGLVFGFGFAVALIATVSIYLGYQTYVYLPEIPDVVIEVPDIEDSPEEFLGSSNTYTQGFFARDNAVLAAGEGSITGVVSAEANGVAGIKLRLALNGTVYSQWGLTDDSGKYTISVPYGRYKIDGFEIDRLSANKNLAGMIDSSRNGHSSSIFNVSESKSGMGINFSYVKPVIKSINQVEYNLEDPVILAWEPYADAFEYQIQVWEKANPRDYRGNDTLFAWSNQPRSSDTSIDLRDLTNKLRSGFYYSFELRAFDKKGMEISRSAERYTEYDFHIK